MQRDAAGRARARPAGPAWRGGAARPPGRRACEPRPGRSARASGVGVGQRRAGRPAPSARGVSGWMTWTGWPSLAAKVVRSTSWRCDDLGRGRARAQPRRARRAARSATGHVVGRRCLARAGRGTRGAAGRRRAAARPSRGAGTSGGCRGLAALACRLDARGEAPRRSGASNRSRSGSSTCSASRMRETTWVASSEWPPRAKKFVVAADALDAQAPRPRSRRAAASTGVRGAIVGDASAAGGVGGGQRPAVHLAVGRERQGRRARRTRRAPCTRAARCRGGRAARARSSPGLRPLRGDHVGHQRAVAGPSSRASTTASRTPGWRASAASISPSSMRKPRSLTWWSMRPRNSSVPSAQPARQVAGAVEPRAGRGVEGVGHEALGGQVGPAEVAAGQAGAADVQLARHAERHRAQALVEQVHGHVGDWPADWRQAGATRRHDSPGDVDSVLGWSVVVGDR